MFKEQDKTIDLITGRVSSLKNISQAMQNELDDQAQLLDDMGREMETADSRMNNVMKRITKVLHMSSGMFFLHKRINYLELQELNSFFLLLKRQKTMDDDRVSYIRNFHTSNFICYSLIVKFCRKKKKRTKILLL